MKEELEALIWNAGQEQEIRYTKETLIKIIDALLNDFQEFIEHEFDRSKDIFFELSMPESPGFSIWINSHEQKNLL